jgi:hypothetical protein
VSRAAGLYRGVRANTEQTCLVRPLVLIRGWGRTVGRINISRAQARLLADGPASSLLRACSWLSDSSPAGRVPDGVAIAVAGQDCPGLQAWLGADLRENLCGRGRP